MNAKIKSVLLVNPWIYDFAAYDFWSKPLGLLYIGSILDKLGYDVQLIDCLDRFHPDIKHQIEPDKPTFQSDGSGKFPRQEIAKPEALKHIPRKYCRYGMAPETVFQQFSSLEQKPDVILATSFMTYWYPAVKDMVDLLRTFFPDVPVVLGGIYATLCPEHARHVVQPDVVITGEGEIPAVRTVARLTGGPGADFCYSNLDDLPFPLYGLYKELQSIALLTSRGCPNRCSFCASRNIVNGYRRRLPENVFDELCWHRRLNVHNIAFFDDALLHQPNLLIKPLLRKVVEHKMNVNFHTPNGLTPRFIDAELAELFFKSGFKTIRLSFETSNTRRQRDMSSKVTVFECEKALSYLEQAGYNRKDIGVYVLMGLPGQDLQEVWDSVQCVHDLGARICMASFSPIPATPEWQRAVDTGLWSESNDLLLTNSTVFPLWSQTVGYNAALACASKIKQLNKMPSNEMTGYFLDISNMG